MLGFVIAFVLIPWLRASVCMCVCACVHVYVVCRFKNTFFMILFVLKLSVLPQLSWYEKRAGHGHVRRSARILIKACTTRASLAEREKEREAERT